MVGATETVSINRKNCEKCFHYYVCHMATDLNPMFFTKVKEVQCMVFLEKNLVIRWKKAFDDSTTEVYDE